MGYWWRFQKFVQRHVGLLGAGVLVPAGAGLMYDGRFGYEFVLARACFVVAALWIIGVGAYKWFRVLGFEWSKAQVIDATVRVVGVLAILIGGLYLIRNRESAALASSAPSVAVFYSKGQFIIANRGSSDVTVHGGRINKTQMLLDDDAIVIPPNCEHTVGVKQTCEVANCKEAIGHVSKLLLFTSTPNGKQYTIRTRLEVASIDANGQIEYHIQMQPFHIGWDKE